jgi:hypothetical protein
MTGARNVPRISSTLMQRSLHGQPASGQAILPSKWWINIPALIPTPIQLTAAMLDGIVSTPGPTSVPTPTPDPTPDNNMAMNRPVPTPSVNTGDVNDDGSITIIDALLVAQYYVNLNPSNFNVDAADTNCDGSVNIIGALLIAQFYVNLITDFC